MATTTTNDDESDGEPTANSQQPAAAATTTNDDAEEHEATLLRFQAEFTPSNDPLSIPVRLIRAGRTQATMGRPNGVLIPDDVLSAAALRFQGVSVFLNHDYRATHEPRDVRDFAGTVSNPTYSPTERAILATIYPASNQAGNELLRLAETIRHHRQNNLPLPDIGLSADAWWQIQNDQAIALNRVNSVDVVHSPAADGRLLFSQGDFPMPVEETQTPSAAAQVTTPAANGQPPAADAAALWLSTLSAQVTQTVLTNSGLPEASRTRLAAATYSSPDQLTQAIENERTYLAQLTTAQVIQFGSQPPRGTITQGQMTTGHDLMTNAVNFLFGVNGATLPEPTLRNPQLLYFAITGDYEWHGVFRPERVQFANANTTTLAGLAVNAMNKIINMQMARLMQYRWFEKITALTPNDGSVHPLQLISYGGIGELPTVAEGATYTELDVDDVKETASFYKKGGYVEITQEMFRNSEVQKFRLIPTSLANAAIKTRSKAVSNLFTQASGVGPTLAQDSTVLFHANHGNVAATAFDATAWRAAVVECYKHAEINSGDRIGLFPKFGLFPVDLWTTALIAFGYGEGMPTTYTPEAQARNEEDPRPVPLAVPHWTDTNNWAYIVDPMLHPVIHISYAQDHGGMSHPAPELFVQAGGETSGRMFSNDGLPIKVRDWFAVGVNGYRGIGKRNVP
ncbi:MAG: hypothetical protein E6Q97_23080 [Desulfurellales bacterium]|nr:MAG: hypothetical protein E6Q97_23080 [Desulfurellales bacterium]